MSKSVEVIPIMSEEERNHARQIDSRNPQGYEVTWYLMPGDEPQRVEVIPSRFDYETDDQPYGLKILEEGIGKNVFDHPNPYLGTLAVREAILASSLEAAYAGSKAA